MSDEQRLNVCKACVTQIIDMLRTSPNDWRNFINLARSVIAHLDASAFFSDASRTDEQTWIVAALQRLAYHDPDDGGIPDVAAWCSRQWVAIAQRDPRNVAALRGIGQTWLSRSQPTLARIHRLDGSSSSSGGNGSSRSTTSISTSEEERQATQATVEAERRTGTPDYVEARGYLQPATEYLERAVAAASAQGAVTGDLLALAAEAYMSLGNVSSSRVNEQYFRRALVLLRAASRAPNYSLSRYLQQYLDDYGRLID